MKILYVTGMTGPLISILTGKTEQEITSLPGFFYPWFKLVQKGHRVDFVVVSNFNKDINIRVDWFEEDNLYANVYDPYSEKFNFFRFFRQVKRFIKLMYFTDKAIKENQYDFIYCKAYEGLAGNIIANIRNIPCGMRSFGTSLFGDFKKYGPWCTAVRRPLEYLTFKIKKDFFIMTDDGTKGDIVFEKWKPTKKKYEYYFWKTGIDKKTIEEIDEFPDLPKHKYLFFAARIDQWKRHDRVIKILAELHRRNIHLHLYFAGSIALHNYYIKLIRLVNDYNLNDYVHFLGPIKQTELKVWAYHALANVLMQDYTNRGNVFFEIFSAGAVVVALNDGTLNDYLINGENGFLVDTEENACDIIHNLIDNDKLQKIIRENAQKTAKETFLSIDERFDREVKLIEDIVESKKNSINR